MCTAVNNEWFDDIRNPKHSAKSPGTSSANWWTRSRARQYFCSNIALRADGTRANRGPGGAGRAQGIHGGQHLSGQPGMDVSRVYVVFQWSGWRSISQSAGSLGHAGHQRRLPQGESPDIQPGPGNASLVISAFGSRFTATSTPSPITCVTTLCGCAGASLDARSPACRQ